MDHYSKSITRKFEKRAVCMFKAYHMRRLMKQMLRFINRPIDESQRFVSLRNFWKKFSIADTTEIVAQSWEELEDSTLRSCWNKLCPENSNGVPSVQTLEYIVPEIIATAQQIGGEGFDGICDVEILDLVQTQSEYLTLEEIEAILDQPQN
ncbi:hypothetical protein QAD02_000582 [Eretmocerus hayati]|uniref:Uncharacterized protein n=1 Tax=Eretmocerus hayati TaxID=131215 RepID=A0ACC2NDU1_9HYME|nr:hypothetical protein QAD02_000582 [Eretmocerus hayati]